ncbi:MAG: hypothetical protein R3C19_09490 [Planctomycetaceae bacterium]
MLTLGILLLPGVWPPLKFGFGCGLATILLLRIGPNPAVWLATSESRLRRP